MYLSISRLYFFSVNSNFIKRERLAERDGVREGQAERDQERERWSKRGAGRERSRKREME